MLIVTWRGTLCNNIFSHYFGNQITFTHITLTAVRDLIAKSAKIHVWNSRSASAEFQISIAEFGSLNYSRLRVANTTACKLYQLQITVTVNRKNSNMSNYLLRYLDSIAYRDWGETQEGANMGKLYLREKRTLKSSVTEPHRQYHRVL